MDRYTTTTEISVLRAKLDDAVASKDRAEKLFEEETARRKLAEQAAKRRAKELSEERWRCEELGRRLRAVQIEKDRFEAVPKSSLNFETT